MDHPETLPEKATAPPIQITGQLRFLIPQISPKRAHSFNGWSISPARCGASSFA